MPNKHKNPMLGWHPKSAELGAWVKAIAKRWGIPYSAVIEDAVAEYRTKHDKLTDEGAKLAREGLEKDR